jgi:D-3-phosphoglycerate dehydrogenase / 2-oxoglutarate reductase
MRPFKVVLVIIDRNVLPPWGVERLTEAGIDFSEHICWTREDLARWAGDADLVWSYGGRHGLLQGDNLEDLERCVAILRTGSGTDNVDILRATKLGIVVANTPQATAQSVADHAIALLFSVARQVPRHDRLIRGGQWDSLAAMPIGHFSGATLGLVGFGRVPQLVVRKLGGFGMRVLVYDPLLDRGVVAARGAEPVSLEELLRTADYVSLHCPLTDGTHHLIDEKALRTMRPGAVLINTARGKIVDERALVRALQEGWIRAAALDVLETEPPAADNPLLKLENVVLTTHQGGYSDTYPKEFVEASIEAILDVAAGRRPYSVVNPEVQPRDKRLAKSRVTI